ncbi:curli production assembly/transport protein CsgE [Burkholderia sp. S171]|uniref:curli production assembly/transport protein CsgE n=1 Tax=Burkholderia sp. S171 TaxID=1641860 RepID=UPI00131C4FF3|nr:curli production assembly/transport protein CsgE [Burkholderia sp. S171]
MKPFREIRQIIQSIRLINIKIPAACCGEFGLSYSRLISTFIEALTFVITGIIFIPAYGQSITPAASALSNAVATKADNPSARDLDAKSPLSASSTPQGNGSNMPARGDNPPSLVDRRPLDDAVRGIVTNEVITLAGQDFYNSFVSAWRDVPLSERYNVSIYERPSARWGSLVWVEFEHRHLFQTFLPPTRTDVKPIAERAAKTTYDNLVQADLERLLFKDQDLASDEM